MPGRDNLFAAIPEHADREIFEPIVQAGGVKIERILSRGQISPPDFWYDQDHHEWVAVLQGRARLVFEGRTTAVELEAGDHITIPAHTRHRVDWTDPERTTVWLAVHYPA